MRRGKERRNQRFLKSGNEDKKKIKKEGEILERKDGNGI